MSVYRIKCDSNLEIGYLIMICLISEAEYISRLLIYQNVYVSRTAVFIAALLSESWNRSIVSGSHRRLKGCEFHSRVWRWETFSEFALKSLSSKTNYY